MSFSEECCEIGHEWGKPEELGDDWWRVTCKRCGETLEELVYLEDWKRKTMTILGKKYPALKAWGNVSRCSECNIPIFDVPLILWSEKDTNKALTFYWTCVEKLGILHQMRVRK